MLQFFKPVEIFDQFLFFVLRQLTDIPFREALRIIFNSFVDPLGLHPVKFRHIGIQQHLLFAQGQQLVFNVFEAHHTHYPSSLFPSSVFIVIRYNNSSMRKKQKKAKESSILKKATTKKPRRSGAFTSRAPDHSTTQTHRPLRNCFRLRRLSRKPPRLL